MLSCKAFYVLCILRRGVGNCATPARKPQRAHDYLMGSHKQPCMLPPLLLPLLPHTWPLLTLLRQFRGPSAVQDPLLSYFCCIIFACIKTILPFLNIAYHKSSSFTHFWIGKGALGYESHLSQTIGPTALTDNLDCPKATSVSTSQTALNRLPHRTSVSIVQTRCFGTSMIPHEDPPM